MKYLLTFYVMIILMGFSCFETLELDHNTQIRVKGIVTDENGKPLSGIPLFLSAYVTNFDLIEDSGVIQSTVSKSDGTYSFMYSGSNADFFVLHLNTKFRFSKGTTINPQFAEKTVLFTKKFIKDFEVDLSQYNQLDIAVPLILSCNNSDEANVLFATKTSNDIQIDTSFDFNADFVMFHNYKSRNIKCMEKDTFYLRPLDSVYILYQTNNVIVRDSIFVGETPYNYVIRN
jgi:hypothetical protein